MFTFLTNKRAVAVLEKQEIRIPLNEDLEFSADYERLAGKIGTYRKVSVSSTLLALALKEEGLGVFDRAKVERYMDKKGHWAWFPLRENDWFDPNKVSAIGIERITPTDYISLYGRTKTSIYTEPVPYPVLLTVERVMDRFPNDAAFFVAALDKHPDPFLAVLLKSDPSNVFVIERWDEPSFRG